MLQLLQLPLGTMGKQELVTALNHAASRGFGTPVAALNENAPERFQGMDRYEARKVVLADLEEEGDFIRHNFEPLVRIRIYSPPPSDSFQSR